MLFRPQVEVCSRVIHDSVLQLKRLYHDVVYHFASVTPGKKWGRPLGFFTGYLNFYAYVCGVSSFGFVAGEVIIQMWALFHDEFVIQAWHIFLATALVNLFCMLLVVFGNPILPHVQRFGGFVVIVGGLVTIIVLAASPRQHASSAFVWTDWENVTGWSSGTAFLTGSTAIFYSSLTSHTDITVRNGQWVDIQ